MSHSYESTAAETCPPARSKHAPKSTSKPPYPFQEALGRPRPNAPPPPPPPSPHRKSWTLAAPLGFASRHSQAQKTAPPPIMCSIFYHTPGLYKPDPPAESRFFDSSILRFLLFGIFHFLIFSIFLMTQTQAQVPAQATPPRSAPLTDVLDTPQSTPLTAAQIAALLGAPEKPRIRATRRTLSYGSYSDSDS